LAILNANFIYPVNFLEGVQKLGIPLNPDLNGGSAAGANLIPSSITAENQSRADARTAYLDPVLSRPNLELLTGHTVTRIHSGNNGTQTNQTTFQRPGEVRRKMTVTGVEVNCIRTLSFATLNLVIVSEIPR
jgi:choline dehydrogenase